MPTYDAELLAASRRLLARRSGQRGPLPSARIRRSISTTYYAIFHFVLEEVGIRVIGTSNKLRTRRRILARLISHKGTLTALNKVRGTHVDASIEDFLHPAGGAVGRVVTPMFVQDLAKAFSDAQAKRHDADYDMNKQLSETDARLLRTRVGRVIENWRAATTPADRDMKHALCVLMLMKGQLRPEA
ncbi:MAG TPA: hypothetical protein VNT30_11250 [Stellaceae bacterium]|nr:hypothetical protein [Stellaceae bacterium]